MFCSFGALVMGCNQIDQSDVSKSPDTTLSFHCFVNTYEFNNITTSNMLEEFPTYAARQVCLTMPL